MEPFFYLLVLIFSIISHEVAHGLVADYFGDRTARNAGRLTFNPLPHIDLFGSIILPTLSIFSGSGAIFGWAKPVPYNPYNLKNQKIGETAVAAAGVITNILIALIFSFVYRIFNSTVFLVEFLPIITLIITVNLSLAFFNLLPLPPFDGLRIITSLVPTFGRKVINFIDRFGLSFSLVSIVIAVFIWQFIYPFVEIVKAILIGQNVL